MHSRECILTRMHSLKWIPKIEDPNTVLAPPFVALYVNMIGGNILCLFNIDLFIIESN
jgi:hypothetical protein